MEPENTTSGVRRYYVPVAFEKEEKPMDCKCCAWLLECRFPPRRRKGIFVYHWRGRAVGASISSGGQWCTCCELVSTVVGHPNTQGFGCEVFYSTDGKRVPDYVPDNCRMVFVCSDFEGGVFDYLHSRKYRFESIST